MKSKWFLTAAFAMTLVLAGCGVSPILHHANASDQAEIKTQGTNANCPLSFPKHQLCASLKWNEGPKSDAYGSFTLKFWNANTGTPNGPFVTPDLPVAVQLWMPDMGHGSSPVTINSTEAGVYEVTQVYFVMEGDWDIRIQLKKTVNGKPTIDEQAIEKVSL